VLLVMKMLLLLLALQHAVVTRPIKIGGERRGVAREMSTRALLLLLLLLLLLQSGKNCHWHPPLNSCVILPAPCHSNPPSSTSAIERMQMTPSHLVSCNQTVTPL
jgi:hypothetical protein